MRHHILTASALPSPASRDCITFRFHGLDFGWAAISPFLALLLSDAYILHTPAAIGPTALFCFTSFFASAIALVTFRVPDGVARYFSVWDALAIAKATIASELIAFVTLFVADRLEGIPRSALIIHALVFGSGLVAAKTLMRVTASEPSSSQVPHSRPECIVVVGANHLASLYIKLLQSVSSASRDVVAVLDPRKELIGRSIEGVRIIGAPEHIDAILAEYAVHGIAIDRVVVAGDPNILTPVQMTEVTRVCERRQIAFALMPQLLGLNESSVTLKAENIYLRPDREISLPNYFRWKRVVDFTAALLMIVALLPLLVAASILVLFDLGAPVLFWQQRLGSGGSTFLLFKFRTLRPPFNWMGQPIGSERRMSRVGQVLRETSIDELPQLLNVLIGDMSLIGPRPLLPEDQPLNPAVRLMVRPGITGWAQINGGKLLTPEEKEKLDEWYVQNASIKVDLWIVWKTARILFFGSRSAESSADFDEIRTRGMAEGSQQKPESSQRS